jgi:hypothetical protein
MLTKKSETSFGPSFLFAGRFFSVSASTHAAPSSQSHDSEFAGLVLRGFLLLQFILDVLLDEVGVGADNAAAVDEDGGRA